MLEAMSARIFSLPISSISEYRICLTPSPVNTFHNINVLAIIICLYNLGVYLLCQLNITASDILIMIS